MKLRLKRLLLTWLFLIAVLLLWAACIVLTESFLLQFGESTWYIASLAPALLGMLYLVFLIRCMDKKLKNEYLNTKFGKNHIDFIATLIAKENVIHAAIFAALIMIPSLILGIIERTPFMALLAGALILILASVIIFAVINTTIWYFVHKYWKKCVPQIETNHKRKTAAKH